MLSYDIPLDQVVVILRKKTARSISFPAKASIASRAQCPHGR
jgi:hypothetical protein